MAVRTAAEQQWAAVVWTIWKERNRRIFHRKTTFARNEDGNVCIQGAMGNMQEN
jgi:hypothetical protein